jgi:hypothetical protein
MGEVNCQNELLHPMHSDFLFSFEKFICCEWGQMLDNQYCSGPFYFVVKPQGFKTYTVLWLSLHVVKAVLGNNTSEFTLAYLL